MNSGRLLQYNAAFLMLMGGGAAVADAIGHFYAKGPLAKVMSGAPLAISSFEAHLLAALFGLVLYHGSQQPERRPFHSLAAVIHIILGGSNLLFFDHAFGALDMRLFGLGITACHFGLVLLQTLAAMSREGSRAALSIS